MCVGLIMGVGWGRAFLLNDRWLQPLSWDGVTGREYALTLIFVCMCVCVFWASHCFRVPQVATMVGSCIAASQARGWLCVCSWRPGEQQPSCQGAARPTDGSVSGGQLPVQRSGMWAWHSPAGSVSPVAVWLRQCCTSSFVVQHNGSGAKPVTASKCCCWCCVAQRWPLRRGAPAARQVDFHSVFHCLARLSSLVGELLCSADCLLSS